MDQETIQKIATEIVKHLPDYPWALLAVQTLLMLVAAALGPFLVEYFKTRGKHLATKADFDEVLSQVRANTELVETVRAEVSQKDWARREWTNLRRIKLEELLNQMHECEQYAESRASKAVEGKIWEGADPQPKLDSLGTLYFPELGKQIDNFSVAYRNQLIASGALGQAVIRAGSDNSARKAAYDEFGVASKDRLFRRLAAADELRDAAREVLIKILGVEG